MEGLGQVLLSCLELSQIELSLDGFTFSSGRSSSG